jgi:hypothetical protein
LGPFTTATTYWLRFRSINFESSIILLSQSAFPDSSVSVVTVDKSCLHASIPCALGRVVEEEAPVTTAPGCGGEGMLRTQFLPQDAVSCAGRNLGADSIEMSTRNSLKRRPLIFVRFATTLVPRRHLVKTSREHPSGRH